MRPRRCARARRGASRRSRTRRGASRRRARSRRRRASQRAARPSGRSRRRVRATRARGSPRPTRSSAARPSSARRCPRRAARSRATDGRHEVRRRRERASQLFVDDRRVDHRLRGAAELLGNQQAVDADFAELLPQLRGIAGRVVFHRAHGRDRRVLGAEAPHRFAQQLLLFAEIEIHATEPPASSARHGASRGCRPRRRAARCARCIRCRPCRRR